MASHYVSLTRGEQGFVETEFTTGTSSTAGDDVELRIRDGASLTKKDILVALEAFERFMQTNRLVVNAGIDVAL